MKKRAKEALNQFIILCFILFIVLAFLYVELFNSVDVEEEVIDGYKSPLISAEVRGYRAIVEEYADQYNVSEHVDVILAIMMQESAGKGGDPLQSSESYCGEIGCINDPALSIRQGVHYFSRTLAESDDDIELAIQSYNFGKGFIHYVKSNASGYTQEVAIDYSRKMYENATNQAMYTCLREEAKQFNACYGDIYYVRDVILYKEILSKE